jgi:hypothetical protein
MKHHKLKLIGGIILVTIIAAAGLIALSLYRLNRDHAAALPWILSGNYKTVASFYDMPSEIQNKIFPPVRPISEKGKSEIEKKVLRNTAKLQKTVWGKMADPNQPFNAGDVIEANDIRPSRRFITGGFSDDRAFIFYEQGGFAFNTKLIVMRRNRSVDFVFFGFCWENASSLEQLKEVIKKGHIEDKTFDRAFWVY